MVVGSFSRFFPKQAKACCFNAKPNAKRNLYHTVGKIGRFSRTGIEVAAKTETSIIPIVHNSAECWPPSYLIQPGKVIFYLGDPVKTSGKNIRQLTTDLQSWMIENYHLTSES